MIDRGGIPLHVPEQHAHKRHHDENPFRFTDKHTMHSETDIPYHYLLGYR
jgi:hypothetical protein